MLNQQNNYKKPPTDRPLLNPEGFDSTNTQAIAAYKKEINWEPIMNKPYDQLSPVQQRQVTLKSMGYYRDKIDGIIGPKMKSAIKDLQKDLQKIKLYNGQIDGVWGPKLDQAVDEFYRSID